MRTARTSTACHLRRSPSASRPGSERAVRLRPALLEADRVDDVLHVELELRVGRGPVDMEREALAVDVDEVELELARQGVGPRRVAIQREFAVVALDVVMDRENDQLGGPAT